MTETEKPRYTLSWTWTSAASSCHAALEEIGCTYDLWFVDLEKQPLPSDYLALSPHGKIPVLIDRCAAAPGGGPLVLYQSAAILMYLADQHPNAALLPPVGSADRGLAVQWLFYMAEMLQPSMMMHFYAERFTAASGAADRAAVSRRGVQWTAEIWRRLDAEIGDGPYLLGEAFSICDLYLLTMALWTRTAPFEPLDGCANVRALVDRVGSRPAVARMIKAHWPQ
jgi:glutathione S-transferase